MQAVHGDQCVDVSTVRRWVRRFKDSSDKTRSGRPVTDLKTSAALVICIEVRGDFVENNYAASKIMMQAYFIFLFH
jgi:transposase